MNYIEFYKNVVRNSINSLCNPRTRFNWGYHDGAQEFKSGHTRNQPIDQHDDPYYKAGYMRAISDSKGCLGASGSSEIPWGMYVSDLSDEDYSTTAAAILESEIINQEYIFSKKSPRAEFKDYTWDGIIKHFDNIMPAGTVKQMTLKYDVVKRFGIL